MIKTANKLMELKEDLDKNVEALRSPFFDEAKEEAERERNHKYEQDAKIGAI